ncbi:hypothetical protein K488DRAFT_88757 [Vararia minispora EC-137]|uniref:Uncharacterized protein n=1 Tax=Vararia minispora EC-137 TaxID=1314806 RepID=A0ACB8QCE8_9AGAM|nr:hypothetical protein K488DRAFT_88757 [Vararia minispora EC-137]
MSPGNRSRYTDADLEYISWQQSLPLDELPAYLVEPTVPYLIPPELWCRWRINEEKFASIVAARLPEAAFYDDFTGKIDNNETAFNDCLPEAICNACQIPPEYRHPVKAVEVVRRGTDDFNLETDTVLAVGSTKLEILPDEMFERIGRMFADGADPEWHLCANDWCWKYRCVGSSSSCLVGL